MAEVVPYGPGEPPAPPESALLCRVYGRVTDLSGRPVAFQALEFSLAAGNFFGGVAGGAWVGRSSKAVTRRDGAFYADIPRCTDLLCITAGMRDPVAFRTPDAALAELTDLLWPHPQRLEWLLVDGETPATLPQEPPLFVEVVSAESTQVVLGAIWSDGSISVLSSPHYVATGFSSAETLQGGVVALEVLAGEATLQATEEASGQSLWTRAGFAPEGKPQWLPEQSYLLQDPPVLTFFVR